MSIEVGSRIAHYDVTALIGEASEHRGVNALDVHVSSTGDVRIGEGVAENQNIRISSTGDYDGASVRSAQTTVRLSSTGDARVWAEESLDATLSSTGSVHYRGDPEVLDNHSSTGRVRRIR